VENKTIDDKIALSNLAQQLSRMVEENPFGPPEVDPIKELKNQRYGFRYEIFEKEHAISENGNF